MWEFGILFVFGRGVLGVEVLNGLVVVGKEVRLCILFLSRIERDVKN